MQKKFYNIRHGDMALIGIDKLPKGLKQSKSKILMAGSHGNDHSFDKGKFYLTIPISELKEGEFIFGYLVADKTTLLHPDHGIGKGPIKKCKISNGVYELRKQVEYMSEGMRPVID